jgi:hypothetical protein
MVRKYQNQKVHYRLVIQRGMKQMQKFSPSREKKRTRSTFTGRKRDEGCLPVHQQDLYSEDFDLIHHQGQHNYAKQVLHQESKLFDIHLIQVLSTHHQSTKNHMVREGVTKEGITFSWTGGQLLREVWQIFC